jgi:uncharacterized protein VirK/YbjX
MQSSFDYCQMPEIVLCVFQVFIVIHVGRTSLKILATFCGQNWKSRQHFLREITHYVVEFVEKRYSSTLWMELQMILKITFTLFTLFTLCLTISKHFI